MILGPLERGGFKLNVENKKMTFDLLWIPIQCTQECGCGCGGGREQKVNIPMLQSEVQLWAQFCVSDVAAVPSQLSWGKPASAVSLGVMKLHYLQVGRQPRELESQMSNTEH